MDRPDDLGHLSEYDWNRLQELCERFEQAWQEAPPLDDSGDLPVDLRDYLPPRGDSLRAVALREQIKTELEILWRRGRKTNLQEYMERFPELGTSHDLPAQLIAEEYRVRQRHGDRPRLDSYQRRFPDQFASVKTLIQSQTLGSTGTPPTTPGKAAPGSPPPAAPRGSSPLPGSRSDLNVSGHGYSSIKRIGKGGFGEVWLAEAPGGVEVAIKVIARPLDAEAGKRELAALELIKKLRHPYLLSTHQYWAEEDRLYIVMELADKSLRERLKECRTQGQPGIPVTELITYFKQAAVAIDYLHGKGVVHRDIKPDNILLLDRYAKVADFGLARQQDIQHSQHASSSGTGAYMAPEVWRNRFSPHSDQYSLAVTYVELRLGRYLFPDTDLRDVYGLARAHMESAPNLEPLPPAEQKVLLRALAKDHNHRFPTCTAFAEALEATIDAGKVRAPGADFDEQASVDFGPAPVPHTVTFSPATVGPASAAPPSSPREPSSRPAASPSPSTPIGPAQPTPVGERAVAPPSAPAASPQPAFDPFQSIALHVPPPVADLGGVPPETLITGPQPPDTAPGGPKDGSALAETPPVPAPAPPKTPVPPSSAAPAPPLDPMATLARMPDRPTTEMPGLAPPAQDKPEPTLSAAGTQPPVPPPGGGVAQSPSSGEMLAVGGGYRLIRRLGSGGFGEVYEAVNAKGFRTAIKIIFRPFEHEESQRELESLELLKNLRHPCLLQTHDYAALQDRLHIVMELADRTLRDRLKQCREKKLTGIPLVELLKYFLHAAEGLDFLHENKVLHRDVKPDNILLLKGFAKICDFGMLRIKQQSGRMASMSGSGTPAYMAPEAWMGRANERSDQYSLAVSYVEMRLDRRVYQARELPDLMNAHMEKTPDLSGLPEAEQQVLLKALAKKPEDRYSTCLEFVQALADVAEADRARARTVPQTPVPPPTPTRPAERTMPIPSPAEPKPAEEGPRKWTRGGPVVRRLWVRNLMIGLGLLLAVGAVVGAIVLWGGGKPDGATVLQQARDLLRAGRFAEAIDLATNSGLPSDQVQPVLAETRQEWLKQAQAELDQRNYAAARKNAAAILDRFPSAGADTAAAHQVLTVATVRELMGDEEYVKALAEVEAGKQYLKDGGEELRREIVAFQLKAEGPLNGWVDALANGKKFDLDAAEAAVAAKLKSIRPNVADDLNRGIQSARRAFLKDIDKQIQGFKDRKEYGKALALVEDRKQGLGREYESRRMEIRAAALAVTGSEKNEKELIRIRDQLLLHFPNDKVVASIGPKPSPAGKLAEEIRIARDLVLKDPAQALTEFQRLEKNPDLEKYATEKAQVQLGLALANAELQTKAREWTKLLTTVDQGLKLATDDDTARLHLLALRVLALANGTSKGEAVGEFDKLLKHGRTPPHMAEVCLAVLDVAMTDPGAYGVNLLGMQEAVLSHFSEPMTTEIRQRFEKLNARVALTGFANQLKLALKHLEAGEHKQGLTVLTEAEKRAPAADLPKVKALKAFATAFTQKSPEAGANDLLEAYKDEGAAPELRTPARLKEALGLFRRAAQAERTPPDREQLFAPPFRKDAKVDSVFDWLQMAAKWKDAVADGSSDLDVNRALAAAYKSKPDYTLARKQAAGLLKDPKGLGADALALRLVMARPEPADDDGRVVALASYVEILAQLREKILEADEDVAKQVFDNVLTPGLALADNLAARKPELKKPAAALHAAKGLVIRLQVQKASPNYKIADALDAYDKAIGLNPDEGEYYVGRGWAHMNNADVKRSSWSKVEEDAKNAIAKNPNLGGGYGLLAMSLGAADVIAKLPAEKRVAQLKESRDAYQKAIDRTKDDDEFKPTYLYNRSNVLLQLAHLDDPAHFADYIKEAATDAERAVEFREHARKPQYAYGALGNALEDLAWKVGGKDKLDRYARAVEAFEQADRLAVTDPAYRTRAKISQGRCHYLRVAFGNDKPTYLDQAVDILKGVADDLTDSKGASQIANRFQALLWLGNAYRLKGDFDNAEQALDQAVKLIPQLGGRKDWADECLRAWAQLPLDRAEWLKARMPTDKRIKPLLQEAQQRADKKEEPSLQTYSAVDAARIRGRALEAGGDYKKALAAYEAGRKAAGDKDTEAYLRLQAAYYECRANDSAGVRLDAKDLAETDELIKAAQKPRIWDPGLKAAVYAAAGLTRLRAIPKSGNAAELRNQAIMHLTTAIELAPAHYPQLWYWRYKLAEQLYERLKDKERALNVRQKDWEDAMKLLDAVLADVPKNKLAENLLIDLKKNPPK
jgi:serine/threonine protein kinase